LLGKADFSLIGQLNFSQSRPGPANGNRQNACALSYLTNKENIQKELLEGPAGMPQTTASKMVHGSLDLLRETAENGHQFSTEEVRDLLSGCEIGYRLLEELHSRIEKMLDQGVEGKAIGVLLKELIETLDTAIKSFDAARERINAALMGIEEKAQAILKIDQLRHQTAENRGKISAILQLLEAPSTTTLAIIP
jgi:hypothetical protein